MTEPSRHERIQAKAYEIWVAEGMPEGRDHANWVLAEAMIDHEDDASGKEGRGSSEKE